MYPRVKIKSPKMSSLKLHNNTIAFKSDLFRLKNPLENYLCRSSRRYYKQSQQIHKANDVVEDYKGLSCHHEQHLEQHGLFYLDRSQFSS